MSEQRFERVAEIPELKAEAVPVPLADLEGHDLLIEWIRPTKTRYGDALCVRFTDQGTGEIGVFLTSGVVLMRKLLRAAELKRLPAVAAFAKVGRTWDLT